jgi:hypothetical protein
VYGLRQSALQTIQDADTVRQKTDDAKTPAKTPIIMMKPYDDVPKPKIKVERIVVNPMIVDSPTCTPNDPGS